MSNGTITMTGAEYDAFADRIAALEAENAKLRAGQEPVAWTWQGALDQLKGCCPEGIAVFGHKGPGAPIPLYTTPQPSAVPDGWKLVPVERITIALESVQNAMEDAYNNAYQECCGRGQGQCCGDPVAAWSDADTAIMDALAPAQRELSALLAAAPSAPATVQGDGWIQVSERLPGVEQRLDKPCEIEGRPLPPLNITGTVQCFDGKRVFADAIEWFDGGQPMKGVTHWKPLDDAPAIAAARKGE